MTITRVVIKKITRQGINLSIHEKLSSNFPIQNYTNSLAPPNYEFYTHGHAKNTSSPLYSSPSNAILFQRAPLRIFPLPPLLIRFIQRIINRKLLSFFFSPTSSLPPRSLVRCRYACKKIGNTGIFERISLSLPLSLSAVRTHDPDDRDNRAT